VQVLLLSRNVRAAGSTPLLPIYEAPRGGASDPAVHAFGFGGNPITASGWPSYYIEEMVAIRSAADRAREHRAGGVRTSPELKMIMIEAGFGWAPSLSWRLDKSWQRCAAKCRTSKRPPIGIYPRPYLLTTQPWKILKGAIICFEVNGLGRLDKLLSRTGLSALGL